ncbi:MAG: hypothetical protein F6K10_10915 [Moorea sp. SIO2B7]|nr:hypothetical protein [Moorena sp. SIO2B7]
MRDGQRFSFTERIDSLGRSVIMPYLPLTLSAGDNPIEVTALLDTGASVNVLPYELGLQLGAIWEEQTLQVQLSGNLGHNEARGLVVSGTVEQFAPVLLVFAWTKVRDVPMILGQMNFFAEKTL